MQSVQDHVIEMAEVTDKRIVFRCGVPSYLSRNNLYNVKNWDQKSIDMANEQIRILHIRSCNTNQPNQSSDMYSGDEGGSDTELDTYDLATQVDGSGCKSSDRCTQWKSGCNRLGRDSSGCNW